MRKGKKRKMKNEGNEEERKGKTGRGTTREGKKRREIQGVRRKECGKRRGDKRRREEQVVVVVALHCHTRWYSRPYK